MQSANNNTDVEVVDSNAVNFKSVSQETLESPAPVVTPAPMQTAESAESVVVAVAEEEKKVDVVPVPAAAAAAETPVSFLSNHVKLNSVNFYLRIVQALFSVITFICVIVLGTSFVFFDR
jgi:hypothetical protein